MITEVMDVIAVIYSICEDFELDFFAFYAAVGLWSAFFLILYSLFDVSRLMKWSTRSTEEIFALFISIAFCVDAGRDTLKSKQKYLSILQTIPKKCQKKTPQNPLEIPRKVSKIPQNPKKS